MSIYAYIPFISEIKTEFADRQIWFYKLNREFLKIADYFVKHSENLFCVICERNHKTNSGLRNCLFYHRNLTIDHFIDHKLIRASSE
jgi:hypothetical protein